MIKKLQNPRTGSFNLHIRQRNESGQSKCSDKNEICGKCSNLHLFASISFMKEFSVFPNTAVSGSESGANLVACALLSAFLGISSFLYTNGGAESRERFNQSRISRA